MNQAADDANLPSLESLSIDDGRKLVSVFAWLLQEDKKQNPHLYERTKTEND